MGHNPPVVHECQRPLKRTEACVDSRWVTWKMTPVPRNSLTSRTATTDRTKALGLSQEFEAAYQMKLAEAQARKVVSDRRGVIPHDRCPHWVI
jgi:hypothetical protein